MVAVLSRSGIRVVTLVGSFDNVVDISFSGNVRVAVAFSGCLIIIAGSSAGCVVVVPSSCGVVVMVELLGALGGEVVVPVGVVGERVCGVGAGVRSPMGVVSRLVPPSAAGMASFKKLSWTGAITGMPAMVCRDVSPPCRAEGAVCCSRKALSSALLLKDLQKKDNIQEL